VTKFNKHYSLTPDNVMDSLIYGSPFCVGTRCKLLKWSGFYGSPGMFREIKELNSFI